MAERISEKILKKLYVRIIPKQRDEIWRLALEFKVEDISQEDLIIASCLWMRTLSLDKLKEDLAPFVRRVQEEKARYVAEQMAAMNKGSSEPLVIPETKHLEFSKPKKAGKRPKVN